MVEVRENFFVNDDWECNCSLTISVTEDGNDLHYLSFYDGETEDNNIMRNFSDVTSIVRVMKTMYELGKQGKEVVFTYSEDEEE